jgi:tRNA nucleotidyltransferase (CCA-adding enzyme)
MLARPFLCRPGRRDDLQVKIPPPPVLLERVRALPAAGPLLEAIGEAAGVYLVGGAVRDLLLGRASPDLDLVVEGDALAVAARLGRPLVHDRFGTSTVLRDGVVYDIARARTETYARPGALPDVAPGSLEQDLLRRDFTVNALAIALGGPEPGALHAVPGATDDLNAELLRVLHPESFRDDPTRLLRLARYASRLGFEVEPETLALARAAAADGALGTVSGARIGTELRLLACERDPVAAFETLDRLWSAASIAAGFGLADPDLARRALALLPADGRPSLAVLALAFARVAPGTLPALLDSYAFEAGDRDAILTASGGRAQALAGALAAAASPSEIAAAARGVPPEVVAIAGALGPAPQAREWLQRLREVRLEIDGGDLLAAGVTEGPRIGAGLRAALAAKLDGRAGDAAAQLAEALRAVGRSG